MEWDSVREKQDKQAFGKEGEAAAAAFLQNRGYAVLSRNFRTRTGEIDLIACKNNTLVFVEVKTRRNQAFGLPFESVNHQKQVKIRKTALAYLASQAHAFQNYRFDVISIMPIQVGNWQIDHIVNAF
jgi:putative endonuclease